MLLIFGGTTEGRKAVEVLDESGSLYYYSTKTGEQSISLQHGIRIDGPLDTHAMAQFCRDHHIRLIVDAAHPFARQLHQNIAQVAGELSIPVIRYERIYPPRDPDFTWIDDYSQIPSNVHSLLATTGVQSIAKLKPLEDRGVRLWYRILPRQSSIDQARAQGASDHQLLFYHDHDDPIPTGLPAEAILLKESGLTGGFLGKVRAAQAQGMRVIVLKRPPLTSSMFNAQCSMFNVNGPHGLRRMVERLLPDFFPLHSGLTTGTCATAAAVAAAIRLLYNMTPPEVPVILPDGETIRVPVGYASGYAYCVKQAGDDPDVTDGIEVRASVSQQCPAFNASIFNLQSSIFNFHPSLNVTITAGEGVGTFTLPGFDYPPGQPAINRTPRQMICHNLQNLPSLTLQSPVVNLQSPVSSLQSPVFNLQCKAVYPPWRSNLQSSLNVTISVPGGAEIARRTFNPRLGIHGGISIIGVSGIVKPFSEYAFIQSIRKCIQVAKATGSSRLVLNSGAKSERFVRELYPDLPAQAFVQYGNYIGQAISIAGELRFPRVTLAVMLGKAVKLAAGHLDTHSKKTVMDKAHICDMLHEAGIHADISHLTLARQLWDIIPTEKTDDFARTVIRHCHTHCDPLLPNAPLTILLIDEQGNIHS